MDGSTVLDDGRSDALAPDRGARSRDASTPGDGASEPTDPDDDATAAGLYPRIRRLLVEYVDARRSGYATAPELGRHLKGRLGLLASVETVSGSLNPDVLVDDVGVVLVDDTTISDLAQKLKLTAQQAPHVVVLANGLSAAHMSEWLYLKRRFTANRLDVESVTFEGSLD